MFPGQISLSGTDATGVIKVELPLLRQLNSNSVSIPTSLWVLLLSGSRYEKKDSRFSGCPYREGILFHSIVFR